VTAEDLWERMQRLGRLRLALLQRSRFDPAAPAAPARPAPLLLEQLIPGRELETERGACYLIAQRFPLDHPHGDHTLGCLAGRPLEPAARFVREPRLRALEAGDCAFLDVETTGLSLGAGTLIFLVALGMLRDDGFEVQQFFLRDPGEEPAMLTAVDEALRGRAALVTFNGQNFDVPLLAGRYRLNRMWPAPEALPNLDLLPPARRLWRRRLSSCALGSLEQRVLGVRRTDEDVPGWLIPGIYQDYLRTGDATGIARIIYHNLVDVLSMVTLTARLCAAFEAPEEAPMEPQDRLSLARWYQALDMPTATERAYVAALEADLPDEDARRAFHGLTTLLRRAGRRAEAVVYWQQWAAYFPTDPTPRVEIAKHFEWQDVDLDQAHRWASAALEAVDRWLPGIRRAAERAEILHRLARLERKMGDPSKGQAVTTLAPVRPDPP
jgi:uncharacterized protein YprB with RNaseH-like and TPR domain